MKKIFILLLICISFWKCERETGYEHPIDYLMHVQFDSIKDPRVKTIKITFKNLDKLAPQYSIDVDGNDILEEISGIYTLLMKREKYEIKLGSPYDGTYYFKNRRFYFVQMPLVKYEGWELSKRIYEIKMYINDKPFFTKKFSFTPKNSNIEFDNMEYVKGGNITITDDDIKKWFEK